MEDAFEDRRREMLEQQLEGRNIRDKGVLRAFSRVPRHLFVPPSHRAEAYRDSPLPIGKGQTISQPFMVAVMTQAARLAEGSRVLEIGTGSGYQAAILAEMGAEVYTVERWEALSRRAQAIIEELGYDRVHFKVSDGTTGWPEEAPFDAIIVTAGAPGIPDPLVDQLAPGGRLVIPVEEDYSQVLYTLVRTAEGVQSFRGERCTFVPLVGEHGWEE